MFMPFNLNKIYNRDNNDTFNKSKFLQVTKYSKDKEKKRKNMTHVRENRTSSQLLFSILKCTHKPKWVHHTYLIMDAKSWPHIIVIPWVLHAKTNTIPPSPPSLLPFLSLKILTLDQDPHVGLKERGIWDWQQDPLCNKVGLPCVASHPPVQRAGKVRCTLATLTQILLAPQRPNGKRKANPKHTHIGRTKREPPLT